MQERILVNWLLLIPSVFLAWAVSLGQQPRIEYGSFYEVAHTDSGVVNVFIDSGTDLVTRQVMADELSRLTGVMRGSKFAFAVRDTVQEADVVLAWSTRIDVYASPSFWAKDKAQARYTGRDIGYVLLPSRGESIRLIMQFKSKQGKPPRLRPVGFVRAFVKGYNEAMENPYYKMLTGQDQKQKP